MDLTRRPVNKEIWKQGQTCIYEGNWGTVNFLLPNGKALISLDDQGQHTVLCSQLSKPNESPQIIDVGLQKRRW